MTIRDLSKKRTWRIAQFFLLMGTVGMNKSFAYDFSAVCSTGQTLYYNITNAANHYVELACPGDPVEDPWPSNYTRPTGNITLPSSVTYNGVTYTVTSVGGFAFEGCSGLTGTLAIPNTVTSIQYLAFLGCSGFTGTLNLPNNLMTIGPNAFKGCNGFTGTLVIPNTVTSINSSAFENCSNLSEVIIGNGVTEIWTSAFSGCNSVTELTIGESVGWIQEHAFGCPNLQTLHFNATNCGEIEPGSGTNPQYYYPFGSSINTLTIGNNVTRIPDYAFTNCSHLTGEIVIPNATTFIGEYAFYGAGKYSNGNIELTIGEGVTHIGGYAFWDCPNIETLHFNATNCANMYTQLGTSDIFYSVFNSTTWNGGESEIPIITLTIGDNVTQIPDYAFMYGFNMTSPIIIPSLTTSIGEYAFYGTRSQELTIGENVTSIGDYAFAECYNLHTVHFNATNCTEMKTYVHEPPEAYYTSVFRLREENYPIETLTIGDNVTRIPDYAFRNCLSGEIIIPNTLSQIGTYAFAGAQSQELTIGTGVTSIDGFAFAECPNLNTVHFNAINCISMNSNQQYSVFNNGSSTTPVTSLTIGSSVTRIPDYAFRGCSSLNCAIVIPNATSYIGSYAFAETGSPELTISEAVTTIKDYAFAGCPSLQTVHFNATNCTTMNSNSQYSVFQSGYGTAPITTLTIGNNVTHIPDYAFYNCSNIGGNLNLPSSITYIGEGAFSNCSGYMGTLSLPNQLVTIGSGAFVNCTGFVGSLTIPESVTAMGPFAFAGCSGFIGNLTIPDGITRIEESAFEGCSGLTGMNTGNGVTEIEGYAFYGCSNITDVTISDVVTYIGEEAFFRCTSLSELTIGKAITTIEGFAFWSCPNLSTVYYNATNCTKMFSREGSEYYSVFDYSDGTESPLVYVIIGDNVTSIPDQAFKNSQNLNTLIIPENVSNIGSYAFSGCSGLASITEISAVPPVLGAYVFQDVNANIPFKVPCGALNVYNGASGWNYFTNIIEDYPYSVTVASNDVIMGSATVTQAPNCTNNGLAIVTASPNLGYSFIGWTENGTIVSTDAIYSFIISANRNLMANFANGSQSYYNINVSANPTEGGIVSGGGTYEEGQLCTVTAIPSSGYTFINWTENGSFVSSDAYYSFNVTSTRNLIANFSASSLPNYVISTSANPSNGGSVIGSGTYQQGQFCTVTAIANPSYSFANWTENGTVVSSDASYTFTVNGNRNLVANFSYAAVSFTVSVSANPSYGGSIIGGGSYQQGQYCTVIATPSNGYTFTNWTENGNIVSFEANYIFIVNSDRNLVANFKNNYSVNEVEYTIFNIFPNPAKDKLNIETSESIYTLEIYNTNGIMVLKTGNCSETMEIDVYDFLAGTYIIRLVTDKVVVTRRFIKE